MRLLSRFARSLRWIGLALVLVTVPAAGAVALLQGPIGLDAVGRLLARLASGPGYEIDIQGLEGSVPFVIRA